MITLAILSVLFVGVGAMLIALQAQNYVYDGFKVRQVLIGILGMLFFFAGVTFLKLSGLLFLITF